MVTYRLESKGAETLLTVTQQGYASEESRQSSDNGWKNILEKIKEIVVRATYIGGAEVFTKR